MAIQRGGWQPLWKMGSGGSGGSSVTEGVIDNSTLTWVGFDADVPDIDWCYEIDGNQVTLWPLAGGDFTGTSNATNFQLTGFPAALRPSATRQENAVLTDNGVAILGTVRITSAGAMQFLAGNVAAAPGPTTFSLTGWTASGSKGVAQNLVFKFPLADTTP